MKHFILATIFVTLGNGLCSQTNSYLQNNPEWVVYNGYGASYPCIEYDSVNYFLNGDTLINSLTYKRLYKCGHIIDSWQSPNPNTSCYYNYTYCDNLPTGFLRSQGLQMYYIVYGDTSEYLLYDFNLTVGSQLPVTYTMCCPGPSVTSIDSIYTPYGYRKRFFINNSPSEYLVEGVGSSYGLIEPFGPMVDVVHTFVCYGLNDTAWFPNQGPYCSVITGAGDEVNKNPALKLFPNPASDFAEVLLNNSLPVSIVLYNTFGQVIKTENNDSNLYVGDLAPGIYFVRVSDEKMIYTQELIVQ